MLAGADNNVVLGNSAASNLTTGDNNVIIGTNAGDGLSTGASNVAIGRNAGFSSIGFRSVLVGDQAGTQGGTDNVFLGYQAGAVGTGDYNVAIGTTALRGNSGGSNYNIAIGYQAGYGVGAGDENILIGTNAGRSILTGNANIIIGSGSLGASALERQLRVGHADVVVISASLTTGDIIFASTASAAYFSGNGSQLTGIDTGSWDGQYSGSAIITGSLQISSSTNQQLTLIGSGSDQPIFRVQGSAGELFSITDSLSGSLFAVNNISGLPILEVFSDDRIIQGDYVAPMLTTTVKNTVSAIGAFTVYELPTASYDGAFFEYVAKSGSDARAGQIMSLWSGSQVNFTETTTTDFGNTSGLSFIVTVTGSNFALTGSVTTADWTIKTIVRSI